MRIAIAHNAVPANARPDESDVLAQVDVVRNAIVELGHEYHILSVDLNLQAFFDQLQVFKPDVVFNLIESLNGSDRLVSLAVAVIESLNIPLTGSPADSLWITNHKILTKRQLQQAGLLTPFWFDPESDDNASRESQQGKRPFPANSRFILKPVAEHASLGMDQDAIIRPRDPAELVDAIRRHADHVGRTCFAEQYISGREFNVSLLTEGDSCQALPLAEIDFSKFPPGKLRIVDYRAKWDADSFEFQNTPRRFLDRREEPELTQQLSQSASDCWQLFRLGGYARVDFRVDESGQPWILEINTNPCLSPDAGYAAALRQGGIQVAQAVQRILANAQRQQAKSGGSLETASRPASAVDDRCPAGPQSAGPQSAGPVENPGKKPPEIIWRFEVTERDPRIVRDLVAETGFFYPDEVAVAEELVQERLAKGPASGYHFVFAEVGGHVAGYASYGHIACTRDSYDLYWIAVNPAFQGQGIGRWVLEQAERRIQVAGGRRVYIETSGREQYLSTRGFYLRCGYTCETTLVDFYGPGDGKVIYVKALAD